MKLFKSAYVMVMHEKDGSERAALGHDRMDNWPEPVPPEVGINGHVGTSITIHRVYYDDNKQAEGGTEMADSPQTHTPVSDAYKNAIHALEEALRVTPHPWRNVLLEGRMVLDSLRAVTDMVGHHEERHDDR